MKVEIKKKIRIETAVNCAEDFQVEKYIAALWASDEQPSLTEEQLEKIKVNRQSAIERRKRKKEEDAEKEQSAQKLSKQSKPTSQKAEAPGHKEHSNITEDPVREKESTGHRPKDGVAVVPERGNGPWIPGPSSGSDCNADDACESFAKIEQVNPGTKSDAVAKARREDGIPSTDREVDVSDASYEEWRKQPCTQHEERNEGNTHEESVQRKNSTGIEKSKSENEGDEGQSEKTHENKTAKEAKVDKPPGANKSMSRYWAALALKTKDRSTYHIAAVLAIVAKEFFDEPRFSVMHATSNKNKNQVESHAEEAGPTRFRHDK